MARCLTTVFWWDTEHVARCVREEGHFDFHRDGVRWFDDRGYQVPTNDVYAETVALAFARNELRQPEGVA